MTWFKVDDNLAFHPKVMSAGNTAVGMWVRAGAWSAQQLTDGFIPDSIIATIGGQTIAHRLVDAGLWVQLDGGCQFHQWGERQPSRQKVETDRKESTLRKQKWREEHRQNSEVTP